MKSDSKVESIRAKTKTNWKPRPSSSAAAATMAVPTATRQRHQQMGGIRHGNQGFTDRQSNREPSARTCQNCAGIHPKGKCPAHCRQCRLCRKLNHFASVCRSRNDIHNVDFDESGSTPCESVFINSVETEIKNSQAFTEIGVGPKRYQVKFKIDTGSQVNILPLSVFQKVGTKRALNCLNLQLRTYNGTPLATEGTISLHCTLTHTKCKKYVEFHIVKTNSQPLLSLQTSLDFGLIQNFSVGAENIATTHD